MIQFQILKTRYVGLTDDPARRRAEHGNPRDWQVYLFPNEEQARAWEKRELQRPGTRGGPGGAGWQYGYEYTITPDTEE